MVRHLLAPARSLFIYFISFLIMFHFFHHVPANIYHLSLAVLRAHSVYPYSWTESYLTLIDGLGKIGLSWPLGLS